MTPSPPNSMRPSSVRNRPTSARSLPARTGISHSSFKDYIVSTATKDIPTRRSSAGRNLIVSETRSSQLRLNLMKKTSNDWMLSETREYLTKRPEDMKRNKSKGWCRWYLTHRLFFPHLLSLPLSSSLSLDHYHYRYYFTKSKHEYAIYHLNRAPFHICSKPFPGRTRKRKPVVQKEEEEE